MQKGMISWPLPRLAVEMNMLAALPPCNFTQMDSKDSRMKLMSGNSWVFLCLGYISVITGCFRALQALRARFRKPSIFSGVAVTLISMVESLHQLVAVARAAACLAQHHQHPSAMVSICVVPGQLPQDTGPGGKVPWPLCGCLLTSAPFCQRPPVASKKAFI
jgi:hypothetical protein